MDFARKSYDIFERSVYDYHIDDDVDAATRQPFDASTIEGVLYAKNRIDAVQWHLEDIIRDPAIDPVAALELKRRIDRSNQERTDMVEELDSYFRKIYSILALKIYHMKAEAERSDATAEHRARCAAKLAVLEEQRGDLTAAIDTLLDDIAAGRKYMKVYRQMKMYNDTDTNPVLYGAKQG